MVGICTAMIGLGLWFGIAWWRKRDIPKTPWFLRAVEVSGVAGIVALECGWIVTEVGRQPWIVYEIMRIEDAVTGASGIWVTFSVVLVLYALLGAATMIVLRSLARRWREAEPEPGRLPYSPPEEAAAGGGQQ